MARDYGYGKRRPVRHKSNAPHQALLILVSFFFGYLTASFMDLDKLGHWINTQLLTEHEVKPVAAPAVAAVPTKPKFEFYTLLANEKGPSSAPTASVPAPSQTAAVPAQVAVAKAAAPQATTGPYVVQVASFKARADAEQMKGLLTLKGFDVEVVPLVQAQGNWFRVVVGPYLNKETAQKAQITLAKTERLNGMVRSAGG